MSTRHDAAGRGDHGADLSDLERARLGQHPRFPLWAQNLFGSAFYIFLIRQFFLGVPRELFEAARVDGASYAMMFWRIAMPICRPALVVTFIFELRASWTDLIKPLIYLREPNLYTDCLAELPLCERTIPITFGPHEMRTFLVPADRGGRMTPELTVTVRPAASRAGRSS